MKINLHRLGVNQTGGSPVFLLTPIGRPPDPLDLVNLSNSFEGTTVAEFDAWISGEKNGTYRWCDLTERTERSRPCASSWPASATVTSNMAIEAGLTPPGEISTDPAIWNTTQERLAEANRRIEQLSSYLSDAGGELEGWVK